MNVYFLVEGKTERKVYPKWLSHFIPNLQRIDRFEDAVNNNYYLISGLGFPSILEIALRNAVKEINIAGNYDLLVLALDTDDMTANEKEQEVYQFIGKNKIRLNNCTLKIIPQVVCMETWFLGNKAIFPRNPQDCQCGAYIRHYDVSQNDPELMTKQKGFAGTNAQYHFSYLRKIFEARNITYTKIHPKEVGERYYIEQLISRSKEVPKVLSSMNNFFSLCNTIAEGRFK